MSFDICDPDATRHVSFQNAVPLFASALTEIFFKVKLVRGYPRSPYPRDDRHLRAAVGSRRCGSFYWAREQAMTAFKAQWLG
jgi:predicted exporter